MKKILIEGHRGCRAKYPENTMLSYRKALEAGVDAIEFDVWLTKDKVPVLMHDENALRTCGVDKKLTDMTLSEVKELEVSCEAELGDKFKGQKNKVPTLEELLQMCAKDFPNIILGVEIKLYTEETVDITIELLKKYGFFDNCFFYAFNGRIIKYIKTAYNGTTMGYPDYMMGEFEKDTYDFYDEIGISMEVLKDASKNEYLKMGFPTHIYCADNEYDTDLAVKAGAKLITSNDPEWLIDYLK